MKPTDSGMTGKQMAFAREVAAGKLSNSDCYRKVYNTSGKPETVQRQAHALRHHGKVSAMVDQLKQAKQNAIRANALSDREITLSAVRRCLLGEITLNTDQIASANILAKASGLFVTRIEDVTPQSSTEITAMLERKLSELELTDDELH
jgi:DNA-directed RNA polymerase subunit F